MNLLRVGNDDPQSFKPIKKNNIRITLNSI